MPFPFKRVMVLLNGWHDFSIITENTVLSEQIITQITEREIICWWVCFYLLPTNLKQIPSLALAEASYHERVRLLPPPPFCLFSCLFFSPGVIPTPFHRQNILCRSCQSVYPQAWVSIWGLTSNIENWPAAPTAFPSKRPCREWERKGGRSGLGEGHTEGGWKDGPIAGREQKRTREG